MKPQTFVFLLCVSFLVTLGHSAQISSKKLVLRKRHVKNMDENSEAYPPFFVKEENLLIRDIAGGDLELSCRAKGSPTPNVTWTKDGIEISSVYRRITPYEVRRWKLHIDESNDMDTGVYTCVVANEFGSINRTFDVKIIERIMAMKPKIKDNQPGNHTVLLGDTLKLSCEIVLVSPADPPVIIWYRHEKVNGSWDTYVTPVQRCSYGGICLLDENGSTYNTDDPSTFVMYNVTYNNTGWYTCEARNRQGSSYSSGFVTVETSLESDENSNRIHLAGMVSGGAAIFIVLVLLVLLGTCKCYFREKKKREFSQEAFQKVYQWTKVVLIESQNEPTSSDPLLDPKVSLSWQKLPSSPFEDCPETDYELSPDPQWEVDRNLLTTKKVLGEGEFGKVALAVLNQCSLPIVSDSWSLQHKDYLKTVRYEKEKQKLISLANQEQFAVKMLKSGHTDSDLIDFVKEMEIMKKIGWHPNIVNLKGVCTQPRGKPLYIITEYCAKGNLKNYLVSLRKPKSFSLSIDSGYETPNSSPSTPLASSSLSTSELIKMGLDISRGMEFLSRKKCVHRDLAARNILITSDNVLKIADFGLARDVKSTDYYRRKSNGRLPVKWMAPEAVFEQKSSSKSDVWSFGIVLFEIATLGETPYKELPMETFFEHLREARPMEKPLGCSNEIYGIMLDCWRKNPEFRPEWSTLVQIFTNFSQTVSETSEGFNNPEYLEIEDPARRYTLGKN